MNRYIIYMFVMLMCVGTVFSAIEKRGNDDLLFVDENVQDYTDCSEFGENFWCGSYDDWIKECNSEGVIEEPSPGCNIGSGDEYGYCLSCESMDEEPIFCGDMLEGVYCSVSSNFNEDSFLQSPESITSADACSDWCDGLEEPFSCCSYVEGEEDGEILKLCGAYKDSSLKDVEVSNDFNLNDISICSKEINEKKSCSSFVDKQSCNEQDYCQANNGFKLIFGFFPWWGFKGCIDKEIVEPVVSGDEDVCTVTGENLLNSIVESTRVELSSGMIDALSVRLQEMIDDGTYSNLAAAVAIQAASSEMNDLIEIEDLVDVIETNRNLIETAPNCDLSEINFPIIESLNLSCIDSDGGKNYFVKGTTHGYLDVTLGIMDVDDCCVDDEVRGGKCFSESNTLAEYFCENNKAEYEIYVCPNGCKDGACILEENKSPMILKYELPENNMQIELPLNVEVDVEIDWGDDGTNNCPTSATGKVSCTYAEPGIYEIKIKGTVEHYGYELLCPSQIGCNDYSNKNLIEVVDWGNLGIKSLEGAFKYQNNNFKLPNWIPSTVTNLQSMFASTSKFNQPLESWDVSNVENMNYMFYRARYFNQPLNEWNVSNVETMYQMFFDIDYFNQPLNKWDVSNVKNMGGMFTGTKSFNKDISNWCVKNIIEKPIGFDSDSGFEGKDYLQPQWGTCPSFDKGSDSENKDSIKSSPTLFARVVYDNIFVNKADEFDRSYNCVLVTYQRISDGEFVGSCIYGPDYKKSCKETSQKSNSISGTFDAKKDIGWKVVEVEVDYTCNYAGGDVERSYNYEGEGASGSGSGYLMGTYLGPYESNFINNFGGIQEDVYNFGDYDAQYLIHKLQTHR